MLMMWQLLVHWTCCRWLLLLLAWPEPLSRQLWALRVHRSRLQRMRVAQSRLQWLRLQG